MGSYRWVNGVRIQCSSEEEQQINDDRTLSEKMSDKRSWLDGRLSEYPPIGDQLDMLWHAMDNDKIPSKWIEWYNAIKAVKDKYPKPSE